MNTPSYYGSIGIMNARHLYVGRRGGARGSVSGWLAGALARLEAWRQRSCGRHQLADLDEHMLDDLGLTRSDVLAEMAKPFWRD